MNKKEIYIQKMKETIKKLFSLYIVRYSLSSVVSFLLNYGIALLLNQALSSLLLGMEISMVVAWICSSHVNFFFNRSFVFSDVGKLFPAYVKYYALALPVFLLKNFGLIEFLTRITPIPFWAAMPLAEIIMFAITYLFQKKAVFIHKEHRTKG
jgi:putative flippase GtrA